MRRSLIYLFVFLIGQQTNLGCRYSLVIGSAFHIEMTNHTRPLVITDVFEMDMTNEPHKNCSKSTSLVVLFDVSRKVSNKMTNRVNFMFFEPKD